MFLLLFWLFSCLNFEFVFEILPPPPPFPLPNMSSSLEPSTSQGVKRRIELISSEPLPNGNDDTNNNILKTVGEFLNFKLFSEEAIAQLKDEKERANVAALNSSLQSVSTARFGSIINANVIVLFHLVVPCQQWKHCCR